MEVLIGEILPSFTESVTTTTSSDVQPVCREEYTTLCALQWAAQAVVQTTTLRAALQFCRDAQEFDNLVPMRTVRRGRQNVEIPAISVAPIGASAMPRSFSAAKYDTQAVFRHKLVLVAVVGLAGFPTPAPDIWNDANSLRFLREGDDALTSLSAAEKDRVRQRCQKYFFQQDPNGVPQLMIYLISEGTGRICLPPDERTAALRKLHESRAGLNHLATSRTYHAACRAFWWRGLMQDVSQIVATCQVCDMQKARALPPTAVLQPLPIRWVFFRVHSDLCGPFPVSGGGVHVRYGHG